VSILETSPALRYVAQTKEGWYFYFKDKSCKIGPYRDKKECQQDLDQYLKTGRISTDDKKKLVKEG
jgi:hypothetical protein